VSGDDTHMIVIQGHFDVHADDCAAYEALVVPMQQASSAEEGCVTYVFSKDLEVAGRYRLGECWETDEALKAHFQMPHMATLQAGLKSVRLQEVAVWRYEVTGHSRLM